MRRIPTAPVRLVRSVRPVAPVALVALVAGSLACGPRALYETVRIPPRIDLASMETIGVVEFSADGESRLGPLATRRFTEEARRDQGPVRMLGLRPMPGDVDPDRARDLGASHDVRTLVVGRLNVSDVKPRLAVASMLRAGSVTATVEATLDVELIDTDSGASLWNATARAVREVGGIRVHGDTFSFDAEDPEESYGALVDALVAQVTGDFHARWHKRRIQ